MFLAPIFLAGLTAVTVPVIIHLMHSPRARVIQFPTLRFLKACKKRAVRRSRLKNIVLLLFRMALIALVALAMAKPWREIRDTSMQPNTALTIVLVLDNSYSMGYLEKGRTRFDLALDSAIRLIDSLRPGDEVAVVLMNEEPVPFIREFTTDHAHVKRALREAELSPLGTNVDGTLREAVRFARKAGAGDPKLHKTVEICVLTDMQAHSWEGVLRSGYLRSVPEDVKIYLAGFGRTGSANCYVDTARVAASGTGEGTISAKVRANGLVLTDNIATLSIDGANMSQETFAVDPMKATTVPLVASFSQKAAHRCVLSLQEDNLPIDDRYYFTVSIGERASVLVVDGDPVSIPSLSESYFVAAALNPGLFLTTGGSSIDAKVITPEQFASTELPGYRCVILCNVPQLDGAELIKLENFLREGGGVLVFLGNKIDPGHYNQWSFLPIELTQPEGDQTKKTAFAMGDPPLSHPIFIEQLELRTARFFMCVGTNDAALKNEGEILARFGNGRPAVIECKFGKGKVILFTSSGDIEWSNFPLRRSFLPWLYRIVYYLANQETDAVAFEVNEQVVFQGLASALKTTITVTDPLEKESTLNPELKGSYAEATFTETRHAGMYEVNADPAFSHSGGFGVNVDRSESVLTMVPAEQIVEAAPEGMVIHVDAIKGDLAQALQRAHEGQELWPLLLKIAVALFLFEALLANIMSRVRRTGGVKIQLFGATRRRSAVG